MPPKPPKVRRPPKRPKHVPPKPDTPKQPKPKPKPFRPKPQKPRPDELTAFLNANPAIASAIKWFGPASPNWQVYPTWSSAQKAQLATAYWQIRKGQFAGLSPTPSPTYFSTGLWEGVPAGVGIGYDETVAWNYFLAYVAQSLVVEIARLVPWSLKSYSSDQLFLLLTAEHLFEYSSNVNAYLLSNGATPGDPVRIYQFLHGNSFIGATHRETIGRLLDWCRSNMRHAGAFDTAGALDYWQYSGYPPVERVISGTTHPQDGLSHWTTGCWGTTAFLNAVLQTVNIPVERVSPDGHAAPHFTAAIASDGLYLSHGDDPYDGLLTTTPAIPIDELFIDQSTFTAWFDPSLPQQTQANNVGRRCVELAVQYLTDWILKLRCRDLLQGVTNEASSSVYNESNLRLYQFYTVSDLQAINLWTRLDAKIMGRGGCSNLFPSPIAAAFTAPVAGSTVSGPVVVTMKVSGQTTASNTFKLELQGNPLLNQTVAGLTDSYIWDTLGWANGLKTLTLTVTDSAGNTASASMTVTVSNSITAAITAPAPGSTVFGSVAVNMAVGGQALTTNTFNLRIDGNQAFNHAVVGLTDSYTWDTTTVANGAHILTLTVTDGVGKTATTSISTNIAN